MSDKFAVTLLTGPRGCSKSLIGNLVCQLAHNGNMVFQDTSKILQRHIARQTEIGKELQSFRPSMDQGKVLPGDIVFKAIMQWMDLLRGYQNVYHIILAGSTRSVEESVLWRRSGLPVRIIHIAATREQVEKGVKDRQQITGVTRTDETEAAIQTAWDEYHKKVIPSLKIWNGEVTHTHRDESVRSRLVKTITHMDLPENVQRRMLKRLECDNHPVSVRVDELDGKCTRASTLIHIN